MAHTILGGAIAAATGNNALSGGLSAGGGEALAPVVSSFLYGDKKPDELTADEKQTISSIISLGGAGVGALVGGSGSDAVSSGQLAGNAVDNNYNYVQGKLLSGDYVSCLSAGGQDSFCGNYQPLGIPHYIGVNVALPQGAFIGKNVKIAVNTYTGDVFMSVSGVVNNTTGGVKYNASIDAGWVLGLSANERKNLGEEVNKALAGVSVGGKGCLVGGCIGVSKGVGGDQPGKFMFNIGTGVGVDAGGEAMGKIGNIIR